MNAVLVMIRYVIANESSQVVLSQRDHMIEELATATSDPALSSPILPWRCGVHDADCLLTAEQQSDEAKDR